MQLTVVPFLDSEPHGVFATRAPVRPNPIGLSVVPLQKIEGNILFESQLACLSQSRKSLGMLAYLLDNPRYHSGMQSGRVGKS